METYPKKHYEKKYDIDGKLYFGRINDPDVDNNFYLEHPDIKEDENKYWLNLEEIREIIAVLSQLVFDETDIKTEGKEE